ncbi:MAG: oxygen-independent coproporphyrinogen-3 oxidase [Maribacter sp.]|jgi:oxygen-independent coproporphyrinogen-3 oxidase
MKQKDKMLSAILQEIEIQKAYLENERIETIYLGGGTPSLLEKEEVLNIIDTIKKYHEVTDDAEITLEANPDDLTAEKVIDFAATPINRFSIGVQSFFDEDLTFMNRAHNADEAKSAILLAQKMGFHDISIDLIYGSPSTTNEMWQKNLDIAFSLNIPHISSYCLTVEPNTALDHFIKSGKAKAVDEEKSEQQFNMLLNAAKNNGFEHYEISNFSKPNRYSKHNTAYWQGKKYLGIGPSAHSFNGESRQWNIANNAQYIKFILEENQLFFEVENLSLIDRYNEYIMISLRTQWGCDFQKINPDFQSYFLEKVTPFIDNDKIIKKGNFYTLNPTAKFLADGIAADLFWV